jgi:hypothetical protein
MMEILPSVWPSKTGDQQIALDALAGPGFSAGRRNDRRSSKSRARRDLDAVADDALGQFSTGTNGDIIPYSGADD